MIYGYVNKFRGETQDFLAGQEVDDIIKFEQRRNYERE